MTCSGGFCRNPDNTSSTTCENILGGFFIRKYYDHNGNGHQDTGDEGLSWNFQWTKDGGATWNAYQTDGTKLGEGGVVYLPVGTKVEIKEVGANGWSATTATDVNITITANNNQLMVFGNWQGPTPTPSPSPTPVAACNTSCTYNSDCPSNMVCSGGSCRNPSCTGSNSCICAVAPTATPVPSQLPKSGSIGDTLRLVGVGIGAVIFGIIGIIAL